MGRTLLVLGMSSAAACANPSTPSALREFPDRPPAWHEHDNTDIPRPPRPRATLLVTAGLMDLLVRPLDRLGQAPEPADDVNALDEVPCSTWFCPRNHLRALAPAQVAQGPPAEAPQLPLRLVKPKRSGVTPGFIALDAAGRKYMVKLDPPDHPGLMSGSEIVCQRLMWAAGYNVPGAFPLVFGPADLALASTEISQDEVAAIFSRAASVNGGRWRGVAVPWVAGEALGGFELAGRRADDPNDRILHENRRSLRATRVLFAWLGVHDADLSNTLDVWAEERGRRFVRHTFLDFGGGLGSTSTGPSSESAGKEAVLDLGRILRAFVSLGAWQRSWQTQRGARDAMVRLFPSLGWFEAAGFDPDAFRTNQPLAAHARMSAADAYWGAKVVTSFSNDQIAAAVAAADYPPEAAAYLRYALRQRRDAIGRRYLAVVTAVENPAVSAGGQRLCWEDLAVRRGFSPVSYEVRLSGSALTQRVLARGPRVCVGLPGTGYRVVTLTATVAGRRAAPVRVHVRPSAWRKRVSVVGIERDG